jgi:hypothetical protein
MSQAPIDEPQLDFELLFADLDRSMAESLKHLATKRGFPRVFSIISWGCAATEWLAVTLNSHPQILCLHAANLHWHRYGGVQLIDGWKYLRALAMNGRGYTASGDVHGISREQIAGAREKFGEYFNCAVLVREPLPRLRSQLTLFEESRFKNSWNVDYVRHFIDKGVRIPEDNIDNRLVLHGINMLNSVLQEDPVAPIWRSEDLTSDSMKLTEFISDLTRGKLSVETEWAERAVRRPASNVHRKPHDAACQFEPWQKEAIKKIVDPAAWAIYERLGYKTPDFVQ